VAVDVSAATAIDHTTIRQSCQQPVDAAGQVNADHAAGAPGTGCQHLRGSRAARHLHASGNHAVEQLILLGPWDELEHG
jgi:hypothetical protein